MSTNAGLIPTPRDIIGIAFSGQDKKTLCAVSREGDRDWIIAIRMIAQGYKDRAK